MPISVPKIWIWARLASPNSNIRHQYGPNTLLGRGKKSKGTPTLIKFFLCKQKNWGLNSCKYRHIVHLDTYLELERKIATSTTYDLPCIVIWEKTFKKFVSAESRNQSVQMMSPPVYAISLQKEHTADPKGDFACKWTFVESLSSMLYIGS